MPRLRPSCKDYLRTLDQDRDRDESVRLPARALVYLLPPSLSEKGREHKEVGNPNDQHRQTLFARLGGYHQTGNLCDHRLLHLTLIYLPRLLDPPRVAVIIEAYN